MHRVDGDFCELVVQDEEAILPCVDYQVGYSPYLETHGIVVGVLGGLGRVAADYGLLRTLGWYRCGECGGGIHSGGA